ncbi:MAG: hypothetical protein HY299_12355 [Verrucomicrobia bacterium]|nr:hypothetical protein [Verrucomicrobiota bacterium]
MSTPTAFVQKLWSYSHILRDDALSYLMAEMERLLSVVEELDAEVSAILPKAFTGKLASAEASG